MSRIEGGYLTESQFSIPTNHSLLWKIPTNHRPPWENFDQSQASTGNFDQSQASMRKSDQSQLFVGDMKEYEENIRKYERI